MEAVTATLLVLGQFRLRKHLADTEKDGDLEFAELEMTDLDIQGAVAYLESQLADAGGGGGELEDELKCKLAEAQTACDTIKMLIGDQPAAETRWDKRASFTKMWATATGGFWLPQGWSALLVVMCLSLVYSPTQRTNALLQSIPHISNI
jgi:hypothetical protein